MERAFNLILTVGFAVIAFGLSTAEALAEEKENRSPARTSVEDGTVHVFAFDLPMSEFLSPQSRAAILAGNKFFDETMKDVDVHACVYNSSPSKPVEVVTRCRTQWARLTSYYMAKFKARYNVAIDVRAIGGVRTTVIVPVNGISATNRHRVLIDVTGSGQLEGAAVAAVGNIKVVKIGTYEDLTHPTMKEFAAVYRVLLHDYEPENVGIFGQWGMENLAWIQREGLPMPGAYAILSAPPLQSTHRGDSAQFDAALHGVPGLAPEGTATKTPPYPAELTPEVMARFPATLLIAGTRDRYLSQIVVAQSQLAKVGVHTDLHVWEGQDHGFFYDPDVPESLEVYDVIVRFFRDSLGSRRMVVVAPAVTH